MADLPNLPSGYKLYDPAPPAGYMLTPNDPLVDPNTGQPVTRAAGGTSTPGTDLLYGLRQPIDTGANLLARGLAAAAPAFGSPGLTGWAEQQLANTQKATQEAQQAYQAVHGGLPDDSAWRKAGEMVVPTALGYAMPGATSANFIPRAASNALTGGMTSVLAGDPNASPANLASEFATGGALGTAASALTGGAARIAEPRMSMPGSDMRQMMDLGVRPTIGQAAGGFLNRMEQGLGNTIPVVGDMIKASRRRAVLELNTGVMNDVLSPIGVQLPKGAEAGRDSLNFMADNVSNAYNRAVPSAGAPVDQTAQADLQQLITNAQLLPDSQRGQFNRFMQQYVAGRISPNGHLTGESFKAAESDLGKAANGYIYNRNSDFNDLQLGDALREAQSILRQNLERSNPTTAADIRAANQAFAKMQTVSKAVARPTQDPGVFSPAQLQSAAYGGTLSSNARMRGTGPYQELSDAARAVLGPTIPDSGTPFGQAMRTIGTGGGLLGAGYAGVPPGVIAGTVGTGLGVGAAYNPVTQPLIAHLLASRYPWMRAAAQPIRGATPLVTTGAATGLLGP